MSGPDDTRGFRQRLDDILRQRNPTALRDFLIAQGQWDVEHVPADLDRAMWMMIAASAALRDQHAEAERWLIDHGFASEAQAILGRGAGPRERGAGRPGGTGTRQQPRTAGQQRQSGKSGSRPGGKSGGNMAHSSHRERHRSAQNGAGSGHGANGASGAHGDQPRRRPGGEGE